MEIVINNFMIEFRKKGRRFIRIILYGIKLIEVANLYVYGIFIRVLVMKLIHVCVYSIIMVLFSKGYLPVFKRETEKEITKSD